MNHAEAQKKLSAYFDLELTAGEYRDVSLHVDQCEECRTMIAQWKESRRIFSRVEGPASSEAFIAAVMDRIGQCDTASEADRVITFRNWLAPVCGYAVAASLLFAVVFQWEPVVDGHSATESVLLSQVSEGMSWTFSNETPDVNALMNTGGDA